LLVVGSINGDVYLDAGQLPHPGETVIVDAPRFATGGKGANQASAAAHAGADVCLVGAVGDDQAGRLALADLHSVGVNVDAVEVLPSHSTGTAWVFREPGGENLIGIHPGANHQIAPPQENCFPRAGVVLCQGEVPPDLINALAVSASRHACRFILNLAPVVAVETNTLAAADPLVVNAVALAPYKGSGRLPTTERRCRRSSTRLAPATPLSVPWPLSWPLVVI
jgi:ribokinase